VSHFFPNNSQMYRLLRRGMRGGLCSVYRSSAGNAGDRSRGNTADPLHRNNAHWIKDAEPSRWVAYYDAASLYPSSGEYNSFLLNALGARPARPRIPAGSGSRRARRGEGAPPPQVGRVH
jgi:hypothetical protein